MPAGQPTKYREEYNERAKSLCLLGLIDRELAFHFDVTEKTLNNWKHEHPKFLQSLKDGRINADANVARSTYKRALGYDKDGKHYPGDTKAQQIWLNNRQRGLWKDRQTVEHDTTENFNDFLNTLKNG